MTGPLATDGTHVLLVTPFDEDGAIDYGSLADLVRMAGKLAG